MRRRRPHQTFPDALVRPNAAHVLTPVVAFPARAATNPCPESISRPPLPPGNRSISPRRGMGRSSSSSSSGRRIQIVKGGALAPVPSSISRRSSGATVCTASLPAHFGSTGRLYVAYENPACSLVVARYHVSADPDVADPSSGQVILTVPMAELGVGGHAGAELAFGPNDGYLYVSIGDGSNDGDPGTWPKIPGASSARCCASMSRRAIRLPTSCHPVTRSWARRDIGKRSGPPASGIRGGSRSIERPATSISGTSARTSWRRSTINRARVRGARTTGGTSWREAPASPRPSAIRPG